MHQNQDDNLIEALRKKCPRAHSDVYNLYFINVRMQAFFILKNHDDAEDVAQEVFKALFEKGEGLKIDRSLKNYLLFIARNMALDIIKTRTHHQKYIDRTSSIQPKMEESSSHLLENKEFIENVHLGLEKINSQLIKDVFKHYHLEGMNHKDVAARLNISVYNSRTSVNRAMNSLREFFKNLG